MFYAVIVATSVGAVSEVVGELQRAAGATERLMEILDTPAEIAAPANPVPLPEPPLATVALEQVTFAYPSRRDDPALTRVDARASPRASASRWSDRRARARRRCSSCCCASTIRSRGGC